MYVCTIFSLFRKRKEKKPENEFGETDARKSVVFTEQFSGERRRKDPA